MHRYGTLTLTPVEQAECSLVYHPSGLIEGQVAYKAAEATTATFRALLGQAHPESDGYAHLYALRFTRGALNIRLAVFDCIGIAKDPTDKIYAYPPGMKTDPIETHPKFYTSEMCGTGTAVADGGDLAIDESNLIGYGLNGSVFDVAKKIVGGVTAWLPVNFRGFIAPAAPEQLRGVRVWYRGCPSYNATYYTRTPPHLGSACKIILPGQSMPAVTGVTNWLSGPPGSEQIPGVNLWRCTEEGIASDTKGWSTAIYGN
ncbi:MAG: hypothetical protein EBR82_19130 [Caulobacteraceae bacterium]|nr:hypothetical protein [Caulobacteraceae bacterium]